MKNFKKIASAIAALSLAACVAVPMSATVFTASATTKVTITDSGDTADHTYTIYQIFTGTYSKDEGTSEETLSNIGWADDFDSENLLKDTEFAKLLESDVTTLAGKSVAEISKLIGEKCAIPAQAEKLARILGKHVGTGTPIDKTDGANVDAGYYIVKDTYNADADAESGNDKPGSTSFHMLGVISGESTLPIATKKGLPSFEKKLKDVNDSEATVADTNPTDWQDSADYDIGDTVPFQLKATLPSDYSRYTKYTLKFHDDFTAAETKEVFDLPETTTFTVYIDIDGNSKYDASKDVLLAKKADGSGDYEVTVDSTNAKFDLTIDDLKKVVLGEKTIVDGTTNVIVEYEAKLNNNAVLGEKGNWNEAYLEYSNNPNYSGEGDTDEDTTDKTPVDKVVVFTYETDINKVDPENKPLAGAKFTLYKKYATAPDAKTVANGKTAADLKTTYDIDDNNWYPVQEYTTGEESTFAFKGLDDGEYLLVETEAPDGYNKLTQPIEFKITAAHDTEKDVPTLTELKGEGVKGDKVSGTITLNAEKSTGILSANIQNEKGATLPSTGGIGTTLFYLGGGALVAVAGVMLITKKRMTKE